MSKYWIGEEEKRSLQAIFNSAVKQGMKTSIDLCDEETWESRKLPQWISVEDRLPEESGCYTCACKNEYFDKFVHTDYYDCSLNEFNEDYFKVTHWMPLPELPEVE